jgi:hypothetical protein
MHRNENDRLLVEIALPQTRGDALRYLVATKNRTITQRKLRGV